MTQTQANQVKERVSPQSTATPKEWYLLQKERRQGPYSYHDILKKLQNRELYGSELVQDSTSQDSVPWVPLSCVEEFSEERIRKLIQSGDAKIKSVLVARKNPRVEKIIPVFIHDSVMAWKGKSFSVSSQGVGIILENPFFEHGDILQIHFCCTADGSKSFNAKVEVLSKRVSDKFVSQRTSVKYSLLFKDLDASSEKVIKTWLDGKG